MGKAIGGTLAGIIAILALTWLFQGNDFFLYRTFAPKYEATRRQVFENTKSYNQGMIQQLSDMEFQYVQADSAHKLALRSIILHEAADYDVDRLPPDLRAFIESLRPRSY